MLAKIILTLQNSGNYGMEISSLLHGVLMETIRPEYAEKLHSKSINPFSQYILPRENTLDWIIAVSSEEAKNEIFDAFLNEKMKTVYLKHKKSTLEIIDKRTEYYPYKHLIKDTVFTDCSRIVTVSFLTPAAFKVSGRYQFFPTVEHIFKSLINRHDCISERTEIFSEDILDNINDYVEIVGYKLRSTKFYLEGTAIPSFIGSITIRISGPKPFVNLINMLLKYGEYSGVGIKTGMGMGAINVKQKERR